jgi:endonuclease/exonuclease/phosphatase (EEP) superfamily protein YafD
VSSLQLSLVTFNTGNDFVAPHDLVQMLGDLDADIVGLQELSPRNAGVLSESLLSEYPYRVLYGHRFDGKGLLSRYPIVRHRLFSARVTRPNVEAELEVTDRAVMVYVVHALSPNYRRLQVQSPHSVYEIEYILKLLHSGTPTAVIGDFNVVARSRLYHQLVKAGLIDTFREVGQGNGSTFPTRFQYLPIPLPRLVRIDYIWVTGQFLPLASYVGDGHGSDHLPVISKVALSEPGSTSVDLSSSR